MIKNKNIIGSNLWNESTIKTILTNKAYLGHMVQGKTHSLFLETGEKKNVAVEKKAWIIVENTHEQIISQEKFDIVQDMLERIYKPSKRKTNSENIFKSKLYCGECGSHLSFRRSKKWRFYVCNLHGKYPDKCDFMSINYKVISDAVFKSIKAYILTMLDFESSVINVKNTYQIRQKKQGFENDIRDVSYKIKEIKKHRFDLFRDYIEEVIEADEFNFARENYSTEIEFLSEKLKLLKKEYSQFNKTLEPQEWMERFKTYRSARHLSKEMVDYFIDRITVNKDNTIEIKWRFSKEQLMEMGDIA